MGVPQEPEPSISSPNVEDVRTVEDVETVEEAGGKMRVYERYFLDLELYFLVFP